MIIKRKCFFFEEKATEKVRCEEKITLRQLQ